MLSFLGEGESPLSLLLDPFCEELAFPTIWFGNKRTCSSRVKLSYEDHILSEIRRSDRRAVRPDHLLFVHKKSQLKQLHSNINIAMKKAMKNSTINASQALSTGFIEGVIKDNQAFKFLTNITGSPAYWEEQKKNIFAIIRQFGVFTFFITLSAAETHWPELLKILKKTVDKEDNADVSQLNFMEISRLIRSDPVTCALYFQHRIKQIFLTWKVSFEGPFGSFKIKNLFYRIEFQHRGSPHVHLILWLEDAPVFDPEEPEKFDEIEAFADQFITTNSDDTEMASLLSYQHHKCTATCKKTLRGKISCRFGAPFFPLNKTRILLPLKENEIGDEQKSRCEELLKDIKEMLSGDLSKIGSFESMLELLNCTIEEYILAIRYQLSSNKIFLKREPKDARINAYNKKILSLMRSNMDIQYVLDPHACCAYVVDYINKSSRGISRLLRACVEDHENGNLSIRDKLKLLANKFYNGTEISAQEAAWCRLKLPMSYSSYAVEFINTGPSKVN